MKSETITKIADALCKAQKGFKNAIKDSENPYLLQQCVEVEYFMGLLMVLSFLPISFLTRIKEELISNQIPLNGFTLLRFHRVTVVVFTA